MPNEARQPLFTYTPLFPPNDHCCTVLRCHEPQDYAAFLTGSQNCGDIFHSTNSYGENLYMCGSTGGSGCYSDEEAMKALCKSCVFTPCPHTRSSSLACRMYVRFSWPWCFVLCFVGESSGCFVAHFVDCTRDRPHGSTGVKNQQGL